MASRKASRNDDGEDVDKEDGNENEDPMADQLDDPLFEDVQVLDYDWNDPDSDPSHEQPDAPEHVTQPKGNKSPALFNCRLLVFLREFKGQSSGAHIAHWNVDGKSLNDFKTKLWELCRPHLLREVIFNQQDDGSTVPAWMDKDSPEEEDLVRFAIFYEKQNRKYTSLDKLTTTLLQNWKGKEIQLLLHVYSLSVSSRKIFNSVKQHLIDPSERDKAGAASTQVVVDLSKDLRQRHGHLWDGHEMAWTMWASAILASPAHTRENMINSVPPKHLQHLFITQDGPKIESVKRGLAVAHNVNASFCEEITALKEAFSSLEVVAKNMQLQISFVKHRIEALEQRGRMSDSFISAMETSMEVSEGEFSRHIAGQVVDMEDVDHE
ncbi:uncharacterized protein LOC135710406 [Ochlerotatus camptorhynchus]|uniref:uncharacterized protein LOC135710406 n=1 Tax=Ochlerotatus camptorhynchus TaxID=644619 RepID=UPI0031D89F69